jgi:hypothetical protein
MGHLTLNEIALDIPVTGKHFIRSSSLGVVKYQVIIMGACERKV